MRTLLNPAIALLVLTSHAWAGAIVTATETTPSPLGHLYSLKVKAGDDPVQGVIVLNGFTLFGLGAGSPITAPPDWSYIPPFGEIDDALYFFSNNAAADIKKNESLGGFEFDTDKSVGKFDVLLITSAGTEQVTVTPEPGASLLVLAGATLLVLAVRSRRTNRRFS